MQGNPKEASFPFEYSVKSIVSLALRSFYIDWYFDCKTTPTDELWLYMRNQLGGRFTDDLMEPILAAVQQAPGVHMEDGKFSFDERFYDLDPLRGRPDPYKHIEPLPESEDEVKRRIIFDGSIGGDKI